MAQIEFKRGDNITHYFSMPAANWSAGGKLFFTAKPAIDDDLTDAAAVINGVYNDSNVTDFTRVVNGVSTAYKRYTCNFLPSATINIPSQGKKSKQYLGDFQFVSSTGKVTTMPGNDKYIDVVVYFDVRRGTV